MKVITSRGWKVEYPLGGPMLGAPGCPAPAPVMLKLRVTDHALLTNAPFTTWTRQKYVPLGSPLTLSCVTPTLVEFCSVMVEKLEDVRYWYTRDGTRVLKVVSFYLFRCRSGSVRDHDYEVDSAEWVPLDEAPRLLSYRGEKQVAAAAQSRWGSGR